MKLLVKADDFGFTEAVSYGIIKAYTKGIVRSTGIMINMPAAKHAIDLIQAYPGLCLGLHVNLVVGKPVSDPEQIPSMVQANGHFRSSKEYREIIATGVDPITNYEEAYHEVEAQILKFYQMSGKMPEYLEGHAIRSKTLNQVYHDLAKRYQLVHLSHDPSLSWRITELPIRTESIYDWYDQTALPPQSYFTEDHGKIMEKQCALLVSHPGYVDDDLIHMSSYTIVRTKDLCALTHAQTLQWIEANQIR